MSMKKPERPIKELGKHSRLELVALLEKQRKLVNDGVAAKLPDKGEKIKKSVEKIEQLLLNFPETPEEDLSSTFNSLSLKPKPTAIPAASIGDLVEITEPQSPPVPVHVATDSVSRKSRPDVQKILEATEEPKFNRERKEHLDLFVRGRRGTRSDEKRKFQGSVALGLKEAIKLRDAWREQKQDKAGLIMGDENERTLKYEVVAKEEGQEGEGEEQEFEEEEGAIIELDEPVGEGSMEVKQVKKSSEKGRKASAGKINKQQQEQHVVWDVQEDIKDIMDMIPQEYKKPQNR